MNNREIIARRVAQELPNCCVVNLGYGIPTLVPRFAQDKPEMMLQGDNGVLGISAQPSDDYYSKGVSGEQISITKCGCYFDSLTAFDMIGSGRLDYTVLGALQVDQQGNIASHIIPGKFTPGMGGAMDLLIGAKKVFVAMEHTNKGTSKILKQCTLPLTGCHCVDMIFTELAVFEIREGKMTLKETRGGVSLEEIQAKTEADFAVADRLGLF